MDASPTAPPGEVARHVLYFTTPTLWPAWPFLPVVRRKPGSEEQGLMVDVRGLCGRTGYSATVYFGNLFALPENLEILLDLPREVFDSGEEVFANGWRVD